MEVVAGLTRSSTAGATVQAAVGVSQFLDLIARVLWTGNHGNGEFPLRAVASLHDLADAQTAMLGWDVRVGAVGRRLHRGQSRRRLVSERKVVQCWKLHAVVEELRSQSRAM